MRETTIWRCKVSKIRFLVMDVDGTLTDGKIYMGEEGEAVKAFNIKDGCGVRNILPTINVIPVIITGRKSKILENRCKEINVVELYQNCNNKLEVLNKVLEKYGEGLSAVAYVGDDLLDIPCMSAVKENGGFVFCPADAIPQIKAMADFVTVSKAGEGSVRECISYLSQKIDSVHIYEKIEKVISLILAGDYDDVPSGVLSDGTRYTIQEYITKEMEDCPIETHRNHIDVQYVIEGKEKFLIYTPSSLVAAGKYDEKTDCEFWTYGAMTSVSILSPGSIIVINTNQAHRGSVIFEKPQKIKKMVCKICVD